MGKKNVVSIEDRIPKLKQERKKKANRRLIFYLSIFFVLIAIIVYIQSPLSHVKTIEVSGNSFLSEEEVIELSNITTGMNIWNVNQSDVKKKIEENPIVQQAEVNRKLPWTIDMNISEFDHVGYIQQDDKQYPVLGNGNVLEDMEQKAVSGDAPLLLGFSDEEYLQQMTQELKNLSDSILKLISEIHWQPDDENQQKIVLYMNNGYMVDGTIRNFADNMSVYPSIVSQLDPESKGVIHIGAGAYFEEYNQLAEEPSNETENEDETEQ